MHALTDDIPPHRQPHIVDGDCQCLCDRCNGEDEIGEFCTCELCNCEKEYH